MSWGWKGKWKCNTYCQLRGRKGINAVEQCSVWEPEGHYCHRHCTAIVPFWFSLGHLWIVDSALLALNWRYAVESALWKVSYRLFLKLENYQVLKEIGERTKIRREDVVCIDRVEEERLKKRRLEERRRKKRGWITCWFSWGDTSFSGSNWFILNMIFFFYEGWGGRGTLGICEVHMPPTPSLQICPCIKVWKKKTDSDAFIPNCHTSVMSLLMMTLLSVDSHKDINTV